MGSHGVDRRDLPENFFERLVDMLIGKVIGRVVSTRKNENLVGNKFMIVEPLPEMGNPENKLIAIDNIGAGIGETVLVALGSAARVSIGENVPVDAAIVGIIDK